ncbi:Fanconi anemia group D2 protein, partial [Coemansia sp. RSA 2322]
LIRDCGLALADGAAPILHTSAALFRFKLSDAIRSEPAALQLLGDYVEELLSAHDTMSLYLDPVAMLAAQDGGAESSNRLAQFGTGQAESFVRLILGVDALQPRIISILLEKFPEFIGSEESQGNAGVTKASVKILRQLRWLDYVIDSAELAEKLLETLGYVPPEMQSEIISALPDIISDSDNAQVSSVLAGMLSDSPELMLPILEALGSLECSTNLLEKARNSVVTHLISAEPTELPVMIRFLLQSVSPEAAAPTILRIRRRLDLDSVVLASQRLAKSTDGNAPDVLIFDVIATSLRSHKHLRDAWLKTIVADTSNVGSHTTLDIVVLMILHQFSTHTKRVESALKDRIDSVSSLPMAYTPKLFESVISGFPAVFTAHFPVLLSLASWLIRTSSLGSQGSRVASAMIVAAFGSMGMFQRQEISGELAVHIGSGNANEVDTAARTCLQLAQRFPYELRPFAVFIKGLLDYVDNLSIEHMRVIFDTLGILSTLNVGGGGGDGDGMFNDLYIFVRKQLSSVYPKYNRIGIVGTVSLLRQLGSKDRATTVSGSDAQNCAMAGSSSLSQVPAANVQALRRAVQLLEMLMDAGRHQSWAFLSMTYDELAHIVETQGLHCQLLNWLHENVSSAFADQFLGDADRMSERYILADAPSVALSLDDDEPTILDILNHNDDAADMGMDRVFKRSDASNEAAANPKLRGSLLSCLPSLLRLVQTCEKALSEGSLAEIDALLVCGMYLLPPIDVPADELSHASVPSATGLCLASDSHTSASALIAGNFLVGANEEERCELVERIRFWPPMLRRILCTSLYVAVNWFREVINAFADQPLPEICGKVVQRVNQLAIVECDLNSLAESLKGTAHEFRPMTAGLVPDASDTPATRAATGAGGLTLRSPQVGGEDAAMQVDGCDPEDAPTSARGWGYTMEIGGLLLSQDETRKFVDDNESPLEGRTVSKKRGHKAKGTGGAAAASAVEDLARDSHLLLRELSFTAYGVLIICTGCGDNDDDDDCVRPRPKLGVRGLHLLLRELTAVVSTKLVRHAERRLPWQKTSSGTNPSEQATFGSTIAGSSAEEIAQRLLPVLPSLLKYLTCCLVTRAHFRNDVEVPANYTECQHLLNGVEVLDEVSLVEACIDMLLQIISSVLYWDGLQNDSGKDVSSVDVRQLPGAGYGECKSVLMSVLGALANEGRHTDHDELTRIEAGVLVRRAFDYLLSLTDLMGTTGSALCILRMLAAVRSFSPHTELPEELRCMPARQRDDTMDGHISKLAKQILSAKWPHSEDLKATDLEYVITQHIMRCPHDRLQLTRTYAAETLLQFVSGAADSEGSLATLGQSTFATYYKATTQSLVLNIKQARLDDMTGPDTIAFSSVVAESWQALTRITKIAEGAMQRTILLVAVRGGCALVDQFTKTILPRLDRYFLYQRDNTLAVFDRVQQSTRTLQNICNHSKVSKDTKLQAVVPQTKRKLEQFLFQVIALMENNNCVGILRMDNLKHRDIRGQVVSSQIPRSQPSADEDSEEPIDDLGIDLDTDPGADRSGSEENESDQSQTRVRRAHTALHGGARHGRGGRRGVGGPDRPPPLPKAASKQMALVRSKQILAQRREAARERLQHGDRRNQDKDHEA